MIRKSATLFTNNKKFVEIFLKFFSVNLVVCEHEKINLELYNFCIWKKIKFVSIKKNFSFDKILINKNKIAITYGFGIIFKYEFIKKFKLGIWNIHPGALPNYRGRHPISHAILNDEKFIGVSIHLINEKIDSGKLIAQDFVLRSMNDSPKNIEKKIFNLLDSSLVKKAIYNFNNKKFKILKDGKYYPSLINGINIKNPKNFTAQYIFNSFRSQYDFGGVKILNEIYMDCYFYNKAIVKSKNYDKIIKSSDKIQLILYKKKLNK